MLTEFLQSVDEAIVQYEKLFDGNKTMSIKRARDIIELRDLIASASFTTIEEAIERIAFRISSFKTGWWIFKTGNSRLKDNIQVMMDHYQQPLMRHLFESVKEIEYSMGEGTLHRTVSLPVSIPQTSKEEELQVALSHAQQVNALLLSRVSELEEESVRLRQQLEASSASNDKSASAVSALGAEPRVSAAGVSLNPALL